MLCVPAAASGSSYTPVDELFFHLLFWLCLLQAIPQAEHLETLANSRAGHWHTAWGNPSSPASRFHWKEILLWLCLKDGLLRHVSPAEIFFYQQHELPQCPCDFWCGCTLVQSKYQAIILWWFIYFCSTCLMWVFFSYFFCFIWGWWGYFYITEAQEGTLHKQWSKVWILC